MTDRPLLLIDVDGVLNPLGPPAERPDYIAHRVENERGKTYLLRLNPEHGQWLLGLSDAYDLVWCTTWWQRVDAIAPLVGLPTGLPAVPITRWPGDDWPYECSPKTPHVRRFANGRPVAWIDDDFVQIAADYQTLSAPADDRNLLAGGTPPVQDALLLPTYAELGLQRRHVEQARVWAQWREHIEAVDAVDAVDSDDSDVRPSQILANHRDAILAIANRHRARRVRVFGSVARGQDQPGSDLDLLVTFEPDASLFDQANLHADIEELLGIRVDLISDRALDEGPVDIRKEARDL